MKIDTLRNIDKTLHVAAKSGAIDYPITKLAKAIGTSKPTIMRHKGAVVALKPLYFQDNYTPEKILLENETMYATHIEALCMRSKRGLIIHWSVIKPLPLAANVPYDHTRLDTLAAMNRSDFSKVHSNLQKMLSMFTVMYNSEQPIELSLKNGSAKLIGCNGQFIYKCGNTLYELAAENDILDCFVQLSHQQVYVPPTKTKGIVMESRDQLSVVEELTSMLGLSVSIGKVKPHNIQEIFHALTTMVLLDMKLIPKNLSQAKKLAYGYHLFGMINKVSSGSGAINRGNKHRRWFYDNDTRKVISKLFDETEAKPHISSKKFRLNALAEYLMQEAFRLLKLVDFEDSDVMLRPLDIRVSVEQLSKMRLLDVFTLLGSSIAYKNGFVIRPEIQDTQKSRVYSYMTSISSESRAILGLTNYDIDAALQTIVLSQVQQPSKYPLHQQIVTDKRTFRQTVADETGKELAWVKKELTSADNREVAPAIYEKSPTLMAYFEEAQLLRKDFLAAIPSHVYDTAHRFATETFKPAYDKDGKVVLDPKGNKQFISVGKKESSVFFFAWTQYERMIREAMMSCFGSQVHQVHDAVYSYEKIGNSEIEQRVLDATGIKINISQ